MCWYVLSFPISYLVNISLTTRKFPKLCNIAKYISLFKKGDFLDYSNYRLTLLLSTFSKIFEKYVYKKVYSFIQNDNLLFKSQFGFRSGYSSNNTIVTLVESIKKYIDQILCVPVIYRSWKAFDIVDHQILQQKLYRHGFEL